MRASRRFRKMVKIRAKSNVQKILEEVMNNVSMRKNKKKEVLTSSHIGQVLLNFCNPADYEISHSFQINQIINH